MAITSHTLSRAAGVAGVMAGLLFIGVQIKHPDLNVTSITWTEVVVRSSMKVLMAVLAVVGITGMYLRQVKTTGLLGLVGYLVLATCYLLIMTTGYIAGYVLPSIAGSDPSYVSDVIAASTGHTPAGDIGIVRTTLRIQDFAYLAGGLLFGIALYRARVLARWGAALLAAGGVVTIAISQLPEPFYRLLAFPNGIAMIVLGYSLWRTTRTETATVAATAPTANVSAAAGAR